MSEGLMSNYSYDVSEAILDQEELGAGRPKVFGTLQLGDNYLRIYPAPPEGWYQGADGQPRRTPFVKVWRHYIEVAGANGVEKINFVCPYVMSGKQRECPACTGWQRANSLPMAERKRAQKQFAVSVRLLANATIIDTDDQGNMLWTWPPAKIEVIGFPQITMEQGFIPILKRKIGGGDFSHPQTGFVVLANRTKKGEYTNTTIQGYSDIKLPLEDDSYIEMLHDLRGQAEPPSEEEMQELANSLQSLASIPSGRSAPRMGPAPQRAPAGALPPAAGTRPAQQSLPGASAPSAKTVVSKQAGGTRAVAAPSAQAVARGRGESVGDVLDANFSDVPVVGEDEADELS